MLLYFSLNLNPFFLKHLKKLQKDVTLTPKKAITYANGRL